MSDGGGRGDSPLTGGSLLARNSYINLAGQLAPVLVAIIAIPLLIKVLGTERFGVLALAWVVMGYFGLFDFGLGRATTKFVAEYRARGEEEGLPELVWTSILVHALLGLLGGVILAVLTPWLTASLLNVPADLVSETRISFYLLAVSVPLLVTTAALRGVLEALQRFDLANLIKVPSSMLNYLGPLLVLYFVSGLVPVIGFLVFSRFVVLLAHLFFCLRTMPGLSQGFQFNLARMKPLAGMGGWLTVSSFMGPSVAAIDRFMIGAFVSLSAVAVYATPYEAVTKLMIFPASLLGVLFPAFSAMAVDRADEIRRLYFRAFKYLLVLVAPMVGVLLALSYELMSWWVSPDFAPRSAPVVQWLAVGILINVLAQVPVTALQGMGRADVTAKLQLLQLPLYGLAIWILVGPLGITGVAMAWALRALVTATLLLIAAHRLLPSPKESEVHFFWTGSAVIGGFLIMFLGLGSAFADNVVLKVGSVGILLCILVLWEWLFFLKSADRSVFIAGGKPFLRMLKLSKRP